MDMQNVNSGSPEARLISEVRGEVDQSGTAGTGTITVAAVHRFMIRCTLNVQSSI